MVSSKWVLPALGVFLLASCSGLRASRPPDAAAAAAGAGPGAASAAGAASGGAAGAVLYRLDSGRSQLRVLVYRGGPLAALGHNHVIVDRALAGWIAAAPRLTDSRFYLEFSPADFQIDLAADRAEEGADFADAVPDDARAGTRGNMLGASLLDAGRFPSISVRSLKLAGEAAAPTATLLVEMAGHTSTLTLPFTLQRDGALLRVEAVFTLRQTALGLVPFSVALGALRVEDEVRVRLQLVAAADSAAG